MFEDYEKIRSQQIIDEYRRNGELPDGEYEFTLRRENGFYVAHFKRTDKPKLKWWQKLLKIFSYKH